MARFTRRAKRVLRILREARMFARAMQSPRHPIVAQMVVTRRCNLACAYCNEFDRVSPPVPAADLLQRVDRLADLGTAIITLSGGEPLLHPDIDTVVARIRERGAMAVLLTNGFLLNRDVIGRLNRAGLDYLQISIDNLEPDATSK
jgi:MoaA/NifB/PqqE/SkfB family radical SAM enzyme